LFAIVKAKKLQENMFAAIKDRAFCKDTVKIRKWIEIYGMKDLEKEIA
jgi:hypothetical protein